MDDIVTKRYEIPDAPYYVLTNDTFMSGWGEAKNVINTLIFPCESYHQAIVVVVAAKARHDQTRVRIVEHKPRLTAGHLYQVKTVESYPHWYGKD